MSAERASRVGRWSFGPVKPHLADAVRRTGYGFVGGAVLMGLGLGLDQLNASQCSARSVCVSHNPVQTGIAFAFLGTVTTGTAPQLSSKCNRSGRAVFGMIGAAIGVSAASAIADVRLLDASSLDRATVRTMSAGLLGLSIGTGVFTAIC